MSVFWHFRLTFTSFKNQTILSGWRYNKSNNRRRTIRKIIINGNNPARIVVFRSEKRKYYFKKDWATKREYFSVIISLFLRTQFYITTVSHDDSLDWKDSATADSICKRVTSKVCPGSIVLFHNDADHTPEALPTILKCLKDEGYEFVFISDLIYKDNYEIKHDGTQCKIENNWHNAFWNIIISVNKNKASLV